MSEPEEQEWSDEDRIDECLAGITAESFDTFAVTGWVVVMERIAENGDRVLMRLSSTNVTNWARDGMLHEALYGDWDDD